MSQDLIHNFEYIAAHIKDYIDEDKLFSTFETNDIKKNHEINNPDNK